MTLDKCITSIDKCITRCNGIFRVNTDFLFNTLLILRVVWSTLNCC